MDKIKEFFEKNLWSIVVAFVLISIAWGNITTRISAVEANVVELQDFRKSIIEMQVDIKYIKENVEKIENKINLIK